ncbi:MAG: hypothetical protein R2706_19730 [Acidimicrobiales bacterium]
MHDEVEWVFDPSPPSGQRQGGIATAHVIKPTLDNFVREVLQNSRDRRLPGHCAEVAFGVHRISGAAKEALLTAIRWNSLKRHIDGAAEQGGVTIGPQLLWALDRIASNELIVLTIEDSATEGLTGDEHEDGNFSRLVRHTLVTDEGGGQRGGSFGIGKAVLWRFSSISTVLFATRTDQEGGLTDLRAIGRAELPFHRTLDQKSTDWSGPGWFGIVDTLENQQQRAISVWGEAAEVAVAPALIDRRHNQQSGTSIAVLDFFEPEREEQRSVGDVASDILESTARWFWPSLIGEPSLRVSVVATNDGKVEFEGVARLTPEVETFAQACDREPRDLFAEPGDVHLGEIDLQIPARKTPPVDPPTDAQFTLKLRRAAADESRRLQGHVALVRGAGMVVDYVRIAGSATDSPFHGVLLAGTARGSTPSDEALERFLRSAEPPSHNQWTPDTDRIRAEYARGARARLDELSRAVQNAVRSAMAEQPEDSWEGPKKLAEMLPLTGRGGGKKAQATYRASALRAQLAPDGTWAFEGRIRRFGDTEAPWQARVETWLDAESGRGTPIELRDFRIENGTGVRLVAPGVCNVPAATSEITFSGSTVPPDVAAAGRTRLRLEVHGRGV